MSSSFEQTLHELAHGVAYILSGCDTVTIRVSICGEWWEAVPHGSDPHDDAHKRSILAGFLAGTPSPSDFEGLARIPANERLALAQWCLEHVKPVLASFTDDQVHALARKLDAGGSFTLVGGHHGKTVH